MKTSTIAEEALRYATRGWAVFPCHSIEDGHCTCGHADCGSPGKHPLTLNGCKDATTDETQIRQWWGETPEANIGIATGQGSNLAVLDIDKPECFKAFSDAHGLLPATLMARTGKGVHLYYEYASGVRNKARIAEGIDVRGEGGYVLAPASLHVSGKRYTWVDPTAPIASFPETLLRLLEKPRSSPIQVPPSLNGHIEGTPYGLKIFDDEIAKLKIAREGERNDTLNTVAFIAYRLVAGNQLDDSLVTRELTFTGRGIGLLDREIDSTLRSAREAGLADPKAPLGPRLESQGTASPRVSSPPSLNSPESEESVTRWPLLGEAALYGVVGEIVSSIRPHTESDDAALVLTALITAGAVVGRDGPFALADGASHPMKLNAVLVGRTSVARKGSSFANEKRAVLRAYPTFEERVMGGLASGEGLIHAVRDSDEDDAPVDKRLLVYEPEWARVLRVAAREGNTLSTVIRELWDTDRARVMTRKDPIKATGTHVAILGHITLEELRRNLTETDMANGFANRHLFAMVRRSKRLPFGGSMSEEELHNLAQHIKEAVENAKQIRQVTWAEETRDKWVEVYESLDDEADGLLGAVIARAAPQMLRLAVSYAALDGSPKIRPPHLEAAEAVWRYCEQSARYIFGDSLGDEIADRLWTMVEEAGEDGIDLTTANAGFSNKLKAARLTAAYQLLESKHLIEVRQEVTGGRPRTVLLPLAKKAKEAKKAPSGDLNSLNSLNSPLEKREGAA